MCVKGKGMKFYRKSTV